MTVAPMFFTQMSASVAPDSPVAWTISIWLLSRSSSTLAVDVKAPLVRWTAGNTVFTTATTAITPATVIRMVVIAFSIATPPH